ncbi:hypothetical protein CXF74_21225 [Psychromonas sp. Urea-02u-13]|nr:hypothetical protein CXF74_21225 [Psychromonas sp. Urea-02u-13]
MEKVKKIFLSVIYIVPFSLTVLAVIMMVILFFHSEGPHVSGVITFAIITLLFGCISLKIKRKKSTLKNKEIENTILNIATEHNGLITASELAINTSLELKAASTYLESCYVKGICDKKFTEKNLIEVYFFKTSISSETKRTAKLISEIKI